MTANPRREYGRAYRAMRRRRVIEHYGGVCVCCGEWRLEFLALDHKDGGGEDHRRSVGRGSKIIDWVFVNGFPLVFEVRCHNCNQSRATFGYCPHERERLELVSVSVLR